MTVEKNKFGYKLKVLRIKSGLTQAQLADRLNISPSTVGMYEQGRREPDNTVLSRICYELKTSGDYLLGINNNNNLNTSDKEIDSIIIEFINFLETQDNLMFNGMPIDKEEKTRIASALRIATAISMVDCNKNPNSPVTI